MGALRLNLIRVISWREYAVLAIYSLMLFWSLGASLAHAEVPDEKRLLAAVFLMLLGLMLPLVFHRASLPKILTIFILFHAAFFYIQFIGFYLFSIDIDFLVGITGSPQKGWGGNYEHSFLSSFRRLGGLFNEPGTYATFVAPILALYVKYISFSKRYLIVFLLGVLSVVLTFSTFGLLFSIIILVLAFASSSSFVRALILTASAPFIVLVLPYMYDRFFVRSHYGVTTGLEFRFSFLSDVFSYLFDSLVSFIFGAGFFDTTLTSKVEVTAAINDSSLAVYILLSLGPLFGAFFLLFLFLKAFQNCRYSVVALLIIMLSKFSLFWLFAPLVLYLIYSSNSVFSEKYLEVRRPFLS